MLAGAFGFMYEQVYWPGGVSSIVALATGWRCWSVPSATVMNEARVWPDYHDRYYGVFFRDPDGNNVEAVCHI